VCVLVIRNMRNVRKNMLTSIQICKQSIELYVWNGFDSTKQTIARFI
jgi:hypothetical protein